MQSRTSTWVVGIGAVIVVFGLAILPAGLAEGGKNENFVGVGAAIFSIGAILIALGIYFKANALKATHSQKLVNDNPGLNRPIRGGCDRCQTEIPVIQCKVHQQHLCSACLGEHYDFRSCVYAPSTRRATAAKASSAGTR